MKINVAQIRQAIGERQSFRFLCPVKDIALEDDHLWLDGNIDILGEVINNGRALVVEGVVRGTARLNCNRCLKEFEYPVEISFSESYKQTENCEAEESDTNEILFCEDEIDIAEPVRDNILLAEPLKAVCSENCLGLCPKCGADRNVTSCSCDRGGIDPRMAVLQKLLDKTSS